MGNGTTHWTTNGGFPTQGGVADMGETSTTMLQWYLVLPPDGGGYVVSGPRRD